MIKSCYSKPGTAMPGSIGATSANSRALLSDLHFGSQILPFRQRNGAAQLLDWAGHFLGLERPQARRPEREMAHRRLSRFGIGAAECDEYRHIRQLPGRMIHHQVMNLRFLVK